MDVNDRADYVVKKAQEDGLQAKLINYLIENPSPSDEDVHSWAEEEGLEIHEVEAGMYKLASYAAVFLSGGRYEESNKEIDDNDPAVLAGMEVEKEHINNDADAEIVDFITRRISKDHLVESDLYYDDKVGIKVWENSLEGE